MFVLCEQMFRIWDFSFKNYFFPQFFNFRAFNLTLEAFNLKFSPPKIKVLQL